MLLARSPRLILCLLFNSSCYLENGLTLLWILALPFFTNWLWRFTYFLLNGLLRHLLLSSEYQPESIPQLRHIRDGFITICIPQSDANWVRNTKTITEVLVIFCEGRVKCSIVIHLEESFVLFDVNLELNVWWRCLLLLLVLMLLHVSVVHVGVCSPLVVVEGHPMPGGVATAVVHHLYGSFPCILNFFMFWSTTSFTV